MIRKNAAHLAVFLSAALALLLLSGCGLQPAESNRQVEEPTPELITPSPTAGQAAQPEEEEYQIVTLLPRDAIPAIDQPQFQSASEADREYAPDEQVLGVVFDGEARAYSVPLLSRHEIVNDTVGGRKIAVTW